MTADAAAGIPLAEMIQTLRRELSASMATARSEELRFRVEDVQLELQVTVSREGEGGGKVRFLVIEFDAGGKVSRTDVHTFRLTLKPVTASGAAEALVGPARRRRRRPRPTAPSAPAGPPAPRAPRPRSRSARARGRNRR